MKQQVDIRGLSTTSVYKDGNCMKLVNLRKKNGVLKPVSPRKVTRTLGYTYSYLFIHNLPQTGQNLLGVRSNNIYLIAANNTETLICSTTGFKSMTQIGNLVNVLDTNGVKILFWTAGSYKVYETSFGGAQNATELLPVKVDLRVEGKKDTNNNREVHLYRSEGLFHFEYARQEAYKDLFVKTAKGLIDKAIGLEKSEGNLHGFILACTALELYDGSYILHSQPVLLGQAYDENTRYDNHGYSYTGTKPNFVDDSLVETNVTIQYGVGAIHTEIENGTNVNIPKNSTHDTINNRYTVFGKQYASKIDGTATDTIEMPASNLYVQHLGVVGGSTIEPIYATISTNNLKFKLNNLISEQYSSLIKSVSVFISREISIYKTTDADLPEITSNYALFGVVGGDYYGVNNWNQPIKTNAEIIDELKSNQTFYKVHEIPFDDIVEDSTSPTKVTAGEWVTIDLKNKLGDNLIMQEQLPVDNFTHHDFAPNGQIVYNSKLHIWDYKQTLFHGWPMNYLYANQGTGQFAAAEETNAIEQDYALVKIKTETGISEVVRTLSKTDWTNLALNPFLSYPDSRAYEMTLYRKYGNNTHIAQTDCRMSVEPKTQQPSYVNAFYVDAIIDYNKVSISIQEGNEQDYFKIGDILTSSEENPVSEYIFVVSKEGRDGQYIVGFSKRIDDPENPILYLNGTFELTGYSVPLKTVTITATRMVSIPVIAVAEIICQGANDIITLTENITLNANSLSTDYSFENDTDFSTVTRIISCKITTWITQNDNIDTYFSYYDSEQGGAIHSDKTTTVIDATNIQKKVFPLTASETANFAYYIAPDLKPITLDDVAIETETPEEKNRVLIYRNALKVSAVNNPLVFPAENTHIVGTGFIRNVNTNATRMSEGQFGQYPLYVFTSDGIYSLDTGTTLAYNRQSPASIETATNDVTCATPFGVVFAGKRGIFLINGQTLEYLSAELEQPIPENSLVSTETDFTEFLSTLRCIIYDALHNELTLVNSSAENYVLNIDAKQWYKSTEVISYPVENTFPELLVTEGAAIKDYSQSGSSIAAVELITRPMYNQTDEVKKMHRTILRGLFFGLLTTRVSQGITINTPFVELYGSYDSDNCILLRQYSMPTNKQNLDYKDFDLGLMSNAAYRNYVLAFRAKIDEKSEIRMIDMEVSANYKNDKMR